MKDVNGEVCVKDMSNVIDQLNRCRLKIFYAELCGPELFCFSDSVQFWRRTKMNYAGTHWTWAA